MKEKHKSFIGLASIIIGVGLIWFIIGFFMKPLITSDNVYLGTTVIEVQVMNLNTSTEFYKKILSPIDIEMDSTGKISFENIGKVYYQLVPSEEKYRTKIILNIRNYENYLKHLEKENIEYLNGDSELKIFDPDSNLILVKQYHQDQLY